MQILVDQQKLVTFFLKKKKKKRTFLDVSLAACFPSSICSFCTLGWLEIKYLQMGK